MFVALCTRHTVYRRQRKLCHGEHNRINSTKYLGYLNIFANVTLNILLACSQGTYFQQDMQTYLNSKLASKQFYTFVFILYFKV